MFNIFLLAAFFVWAFLFRGFFSGELALTYDAVPYYEHIKFFIDQITQGVFPLWDPTRDNGVANEFFLRRFGEFNPFFSLIIIFNKLGLAYTQSYLAFLAVYYFIGLVGFYLLAKEIFQDRRLAWVAYLLFLFASFGTTLFKSFMVLLFVPMVWFFYFLWMFTREPKRDRLWGMVFCFMILATTYVPFYFLTIVLIFLFCFFLLYNQQLKKILDRYRKFIFSNKLFSFVCLILVCAALIPGLLFFSQMKRGDVVFPQRQASLMEESLVVPMQSVSMGGIPATSIGGRILGNLDDLQVGQFYIPIFAYVLFLLGIITPISRRIVFLTIWGFLIYLIALYDATPLYPFLYDHVFFFKYFRNFQFFLWVLILPIFILICVDQLKSFLEFKKDTKKQRIILLAFIGVIHGGLLILLLLAPNVVFSSYVVIGLSLMFFIMYLSGKIKMSQVSFLLFMLALIILQPLEVYQALAKNSPKAQGYYRYDWPYMSPNIPNQEQKEELIKQYDRRRLKEPLVASTKPVLNMYMTTRWDILLREQFPGEYFTYGKILVADAITRPDDFLTPQIITNDSPEVKVLSFNANSIRLKTDFSSRQYLVYNDHYDQHWQAFLDGKKVSIDRARIAFKGLWIPAGVHELYLYYGDSWQYAFKYIYLALFYLVFIGLIVLRLKYA